MEKIGSSEAGVDNVATLVNTGNGDGGGMEERRNCHNCVTSRAFSQLVQASEKFGLKLVEVDS